MNGNVIKYKGMNDLSSRLKQLSTWVFVGRYFHYCFSCVHYHSCLYIFLRSLRFNNLDIFICNIIKVVFPLCSFDRVLRSRFAIVAETKHVHTVNLYVYYGENIQEKWLNFWNQTLVMRKQKYHEQYENKPQNLLRDKVPSRITGLNCSLT